MQGSLDGGRAGWFEPADIEGANVAASTAGGSSAGVGDAQAKTDYTDGTAVFIKTKGGLMYEAAIGGQMFSFKSLE